MRKLLFGLMLALAATCAPAFAGSPTTLVFSDTFTGRAVTPTGATTGSYGPPNSSWGVGNGWYDLVGSPGTVPGNGWNISSTGATSTIYSKFGLLVQDPALTPTPNSRIVAQFPSTVTTNNATYYVECRGTYNGDGYTAVLSPAAGTYTLVRLSAGNTSAGTFTITTISTANFTYTTGHTLSLDLTCTGDGASTTSLTGVYKDVTSSTTIGTLTGTDTTLELQSGGRVGVGTYTTGTSGSQSVNSVQIYSDQALSYGAPTYIGFMGDSLTYGLSTTLQTTPDLFCRILNSTTLSKRYVPINMGFSGATTANWANGASTGYMAALVQNMNALGAKTLFITLGSNDALQSVAATTAISNLSAEITYLQSQISGLQIYINVPPYFDWVRFNNAFSVGSAASLPLLRTYNYVSLQNGSTVLINDTIANTTFQYLNYQGLTDGGHPSDQGVPELMYLWLLAYLKNSNQIGGATTSTITFVGH